MHTCHSAKSYIVCEFKKINVKMSSVERKCTFVSTYMFTPWESHKCSHCLGSYKARMPGTGWGLVYWTFHCQEGVMVRVEQSF